MNLAKEILIYADSITYDEEENIIAKGNAKIFQKNRNSENIREIFDEILQKSASSREF